MLFKLNAHRSMHYGLLFINLFISVTVIKCCIVD